MNNIFNIATNQYVQSVKCAEIEGSATSNPAELTIVSKDVEFIKIPEELYVELGDVIPYQLTFKNVGDVTITKIQVTDVLAEGLEFVSNSLKVNNVAIAGDIQSGIIINNVILPGGQVVITFGAKVVAIPPTTYSNVANATYYYQVISGGSVSSSTIVSNTTIARAVKVLLAVKKTADKVEVQKKDEILYTITIMNEGNVDALDMILIDNLPVQVEYIPESFMVNGIPVAEPINLAKGVAIGNLAPKATMVISFMVNVIDDTIPVAVNRGQIDYQYQKEPTKPPVNNSTNSNFAVVTVHKPEITMTKAASVKEVMQGDTVTYTIVTKNTGTLEGDNVVIKDILPQGMTFVPGSLTVNGVSNTGDLTLGINVGNLVVGQQVTITFKATVATVPPTTFSNVASATYSYVLNGVNTTGTANSNTVIVNTIYVTVTKKVSEIQAQVGDTLDYTITVVNKGTATLENITLNDQLDSNLVLVPTSVKINGEAAIGDLSDLVLPQLKPGGTIIITFSALVEESASGKNVVNSAQVVYVTQAGKTYTVTSNSVTTNVEDNECSIVLTVKKSVNSDCASIGDILKYTIIMMNRGNKEAKKVTVSDILDENLLLVPNSITIDGVISGTSMSGLKVGIIEPGESIAVTYQATVIGGEGLCIKNHATITYVGCGNSIINTQTNQVNVKVHGVCPPQPPCPPKPPCPPQPPCPPCPPCPPQPPCECDCTIERVITPITLPAYMNRIDQIVNISGFVKNVKKINNGYCYQLLVIYVIKVDYINCIGNRYMYQEVEEVYLDLDQSFRGVSVEIVEIEEPYQVSCHYVEVGVSFRVCAE